MNTPTPDPGVGEKPFLEHLEDLRATLIRAAASLTVGVVVAIPLVPYIVGILKSPLAGTGLDPDTFLRVIRIGDGFGVATRVAFWAGMVIGMPGLLWAASQFVFPGLTARERRVVLLTLLASTVLFAVGVTLGFVTTIRVALMWMLQVNTWLGVDCEFVELADYCSFVLKLLIGFGLVFQLPILVLALGVLGIIDSNMMREKRRHVIVGLMVVAMLLTPPDPMTMIMMSVPLIGLYEACIWIVWARERRRAGLI